MRIKIIVLLLISITLVFSKKKSVKSKRKNKKSYQKIQRSSSPGSIISIKPFTPSEAQKWNIQQNTSEKKIVKKKKLRNKKLRRLRKLEKLKREQEEQKKKLEKQQQEQLTTSPQIEFEKRKLQHSSNLNHLPNGETCGRPTVQFSEGLFTKNIPLLRKKRSTNFDPRDLSWFNDDENYQPDLSTSENWGARIVGGSNAVAHSWPWAVLLTVCIE